MGNDQFGGKGKDKTRQDQNKGGLGGTTQKPTQPNQQGGFNKPQNTQKQPWNDTNRHTDQGTDKNK